MKVVKRVPDPDPRVGVRDRWLDGLFDGKLRCLEPTDWDGRYKSLRGAANAIRQAANSRGISVSVQTRGDDLYVQANLNGTSDTPEG